MISADRPPGPRGRGVRLEALPRSATGSSCHSSSSSVGSNFDLEALGSRHPFRVAQAPDVLRPLPRSCSGRPPWCSTATSSRGAGAHSPWPSSRPRSCRSWWPSPQSPSRRGTCASGTAASLVGAGILSTRDPGRSSASSCAHVLRPLSVSGAGAGRENPRRRRRGQDGGAIHRGLRDGGMVVDSSAPASRRCGTVGRDRLRRGRARRDAAGHRRLRDCRRLRADQQLAPVLMLTARDAVEDRVARAGRRRGRLPGQAVLASPSCWLACARWCGAGRSSARRCSRSAT